MNNIIKIYIFAFIIFFLISVFQAVLDKKIIFFFSILLLPSLCDFLVVILAMHNKLPNEFKTKELSPGYGYGSINFTIKINTIKKKEYIASKEGKRLLSISYFFVVLFIVIIFFPCFY